MCGASWALEISRGTPCKVYDCVTTMLYPETNKNNIELNCNWKKLKNILKGNKIYNQSK